MSASDAIVERIEAAGAGWVFTPSDFLDLGTPHLVGMVLLRLVRQGRIRRLVRGIYDVPRNHAAVGLLLPTADAIAHAVARRDGATIQPSEAMAANLLSLTEQVPARVEYETDGPARTVRVGRLTIRFRRRGPRRLGGPTPASSLVFAALRSLGRTHVTHERVAHLREALSREDRRQLLDDLRLAPAWMHVFLRYIADVVEPERSARRRPVRQPPRGRARR